MKGVGVFSSVGSFLGDYATFGAVFLMHYYTPDTNVMFGAARLRGELAASS